MASPEILALAQAWDRVVRMTALPSNFDGEATPEAHQALEDIQELLRQHLVATKDYRSYSLLQFLGLASLESERRLWPERYELARREVELALSEANVATGPGRTDLNQSVDAFMSQTQPAQPTPFQTDSLEPLFDGIFDLRKAGYTWKPIREWVMKNGLDFHHGAIANYFRRKLQEKSLRDPFRDNGDELSVQLTDAHEQLLAVVSTSGGLTTGKVAEGVDWRFGRDRASHGAYVRRCLLELKNAGLVRELDNKRPVRWIKTA